MAFETHLSDAELERLALLSEELGETVQIIGKILRHGYSSYNPLIEDVIYNRSLLEKELGDVLHAIDRMVGAKDISAEYLEYHKTKKAEHIGQWLHFQEQEYER